MSGTSFLAHAGDLLGAYVQSFLVEIQSVRLGKDAEALHRMRVASRRLRAALRVFGGIIPHKKTKAYRQAIRMVGRALGQGRQLDIQLRFLGQVAQSQENADYRAGIKVIADALKKKRAQAQKQIKAVLQDPLVRKRLGELQACLAQGLRTPGDCEKRGDFFSPQDIAQTRLKDLLRYAPYVYKPAKVRQLHLMRIAAKNVRYTLEALVWHYGKRIHKHIRAARALQDVLGDLHEMDVWLDYLPEAPKQSGNDLHLAGAIAQLRKKCTKLRARTYAKFVKKWQELEAENTWKELSQILLKNKH